MIAVNHAIRFPVRSHAPRGAAPHRPAHRMPRPRNGPRRKPTHRRSHASPAATHEDVERSRSGNGGREDRGCAPAAHADVAQERSSDPGKRGCEVHRRQARRVSKRAGPGSPDGRNRDGRVDGDDHADEGARRSPAVSLSIPTSLPTSPRTGRLRPRRPRRGVREHLRGARVSSSGRASPMRGPGIHCPGSVMYSQPAARRTSPQQPERVRPARLRVFPRHRGGHDWALWRAQAANALLAASKHLGRSPRV